MKQVYITILFLMITIPISAQIDSMVYQSPAALAEESLAFISFKKGEVKDWDEYRSLYLPNATKLVFRPKTGRPMFQQAMKWNVEEFIKYAGPGYPTTGFEEYVIGLEVNEFNGLATVFQTFYCKNLDGSYESRGVNAYQMVYIDNRWWIAFTTWTDETDEVKLPDNLLYPEYQSKK